MGTVRVADIRGGGDEMRERGDEGLIRAILVLRARVDEAGVSPN